jgi:beta-galactosidase/beta-glucuronidase
MRAFEACEWWYTREFTFPVAETTTGARWDRVFGGLDTLATAWVNGVEVGQAANMLIEHRFDVTAALNVEPGAVNCVAVRLGSALKHARRFHYDAASMNWEHREEGLFIRKPPHVWGWDIMPRVVSAGIWRSVGLEERLPNAIEQLYYWPNEVTPEGATLGVRFQFRTVQYRVWDADGGETVAEGTFAAPANENWQVARIRTYASDRRLYVIKWEVGGDQFRNHYLGWLSRKPPTA